MIERRSVCVCVKRILLQWSTMHCMLWKISVERQTSKVECYKLRTFIILKDYKSWHIQHDGLSHEVYQKPVEKVDKSILKSTVNILRYFNNNKRLYSETPVQIVKFYSKWAKLLKPEEIFSAASKIRPNRNKCENPVGLILE